MTTQRRGRRAQQQEATATQEQPEDQQVVQDVTDPAEISPDDNVSQPPDPVTDVLGDEELSFEDQLAEYQKTLAETEEAVRAANEAKRKIAELQSQLRTRQWTAFLDTAPEDLIASSEMVSVREFVESGFKMARSTGNANSGTTRGPNQPISDTDRIAYAGISLGLLRDGKKQADVGKALATIFPAYHQEAVRGAAVNHGSAVRSMVVTDKDNRSWGFVGFTGKVDRLADRTSEELTAAYERILEMATEEETERITEALAAHS